MMKDLTYLMKSTLLSSCCCFPCTFCFLADAFRPLHSSSPVHVRMPLYSGWLEVITTSGWRVSLHPLLKSAHAAQCTQGLNCLLYIHSN